MSPYRTPPPAPKLAPVPWWRRLWNGLRNAMRDDRDEQFWRATAEAIVRTTKREEADWSLPFRPNYVALCERCECPVDNLSATRLLSGDIAFLARCHGCTSLVQRSEFPPPDVWRVLYCFRDEVEVAPSK